MAKTERELFIFYQFNGDNKSFCNQKCPYCHREGTPVLMADFSWKPIEQVQIGDEVIGFEFVNHHYITKVVKVSATFNRQTEVVKLETDMGTTFCTSDHSWMITTRGNSKYTYRKTEDITKERIRFLSQPVLPPVIDEDYKVGWLNGVLRGDGCTRFYPKNDKTKYYFRLAVKDHEILERFKEYTSHRMTEYKFSENMQAVQCNNKVFFFNIKEIMDKRVITNLSFAKGFLAGIFDAEGSFSQGSLRISNNNPEILEDIQKAYNILGFKAKLEISVKGDNDDVHTIRLMGGIPEQIKFFALINPSISRKRNDLIGRTTHNPFTKQNASVLSLTKAGVTNVYNITTETHNYVANGFVSKNCYGHDKTFLHYWNGEVCRWEKAFERLNRDIYFVMSYGEALGSQGFYECVYMIGKHPNWTLHIITNNSYNPEKLLNSKLAKDGRLYITACWHPLGVEDPEQGWENFKRNLLMYKKANVPLNVSYVWYKPQIQLFPKYFDWLDKHDFRVVVRRYVDTHPSFKIPVIRRLKRFAGKSKLSDYTEAERGYLYASTCGKVRKYGLDLASTLGKPCSAGKDMILVKHDGTVALCACCYGRQDRIGNIFSPDFKLNNHLIKCPTNTCGGDFGMLHFEDPEFGALPKHLGKDNFLMLVEGTSQSSPVQYEHREEMLEWLEKLRC